MGSNRLESFSTDQLKPEVGKRVRRMEQFRRLHERLLKRLKVVERETRALGRMPNVVRRMADPPSSRKKNGYLADFMAKVMKGKKPMRAAQIAAAVKKAGYRTTSANPKAIVSQALIKDRRFKRVQRGLYRLR